jgi:hypothetical protein
MQDRISRLKKKLSEEKRVVSIDQARIITRIYKETEGEPRAIQRAKSFRACCKELPLAIDPDELIVGNRTHGRRAGVIFPEAGISWLEKEIKNLPCREQDRFEVRKGLAGEIWCLLPGFFFANTGEWNITDLSSGNGLVKSANNKIASGTETSLAGGQLTSLEIVNACHNGDTLAIELIEKEGRY